MQELLDVFGHAAVNGIKSGLQQTYSDSMRSIILPAYERANAELFKQLYDTFNKGTVACKFKILINFPYLCCVCILFHFFFIHFSDTNQLVNYTKMYEPIHAELGNLMRAVPDQLRNVNEATVSMCSQRIITELNKDIKSLQTNLTKAIKDNIKVEVCKRLDQITIQSFRSSVLLMKIHFSFSIDQKRFRITGGQS